MTKIRPLCVYHADCADGYASACVVSLKFQHNIDLYPADYNDLPPDVTGRDIYIVDFSYKQTVMRKIITAAAHVTVIDHHKSALEELTPLMNDQTLYGKASFIFDMTRSGVGLTWKHFFPKAEFPALFRYVEDYDLFIFLYGETSHEIHAAITSYPYTLDAWTYLLGVDKDLLAREGRAILRKTVKDVNDILQQDQRHMLIGGYKVPVVNAPRFYRDVIGQRLHTETSPFSASYHDTPKGRVFSLRAASNSAVDVSLIARVYGGGGHQAAASFTAALGWEGDINDPA